MATEVFANSPTPGVVSPLTTLADPISSTSVTGITTHAAAPTTLQDGQFRIEVQDGTNTEIMLVTAGADGTSWTVTRGSDLDAPDTCTSYTFAAGSKVLHVLTAGALITALSQVSVDGGSSA